MEAGATSIHGSRASRLTPVILSPNFAVSFWWISAGVIPSVLKKRDKDKRAVRRSGHRFALPLGRGGRRRRGACSCIFLGSGVRDRADPVEIAALPDVGEG